jgi:DNA-binding PadR family transcriptional regulator
MYSEAIPTGWGQWINRPEKRRRHRHRHHHFHAMRGMGPEFEGPPWRGGPFGPGFRGGFGGPGFGGPGFGGPFGGGRGRRRRGDVRLAMLMLLAEEPRNGYGLMQAIEERSDGRWRPSPGSVYPALSQLEDEGFVRAVEREGGRVFEITDAGRENLAERGDINPPWVEQDAPSGERLGELRSAATGLAKAAWQVAHDANDAQLAEATKVLADARRALYRILAAEPEDQDTEA